jgi:hypothetical protein
MPQVRTSRTAGGRPGLTYVGGAQATTVHASEMNIAKARRKKRMLVVQAQRLARTEEISDWRATAEQLAILHIRWRSAGNAGAEDERLYRRFCKAVELFKQRHREYLATVPQLQQNATETRQDDEAEQQPELVS